MNVRAVVVDDNVVVRMGLVSLLEAEGIEVVGEAGDGESALALIERLRPDVVLLDVQMPLLDGVAAAAAISRTSKVVMLTYTDDSDVVRAAIANGAVGYLVHGSFTPAELTGAVNEAVAGGHPFSQAAISALVGAVRESPAGSAPPPAPAGAAPPPAGAAAAGPPPGAADPPAFADAARFDLSAREAEVMRLIVQGFSNGEIAHRLFLAEKTVKNHVNRIYAKLGVGSRGAAIAHWIGTAQEETR
ncbi:response regulator [Actinomadura violacea]|uniref:Response regulator transcription factor n=1 Tax=Actinomadura violacea TaxID=2819934 RepID=A0ABS3S5C4_9ACTN|nr:response regulator transcription factor [Actinomadura violacea]MBO2463763.1 response regulator transcription factor [Actinomadura violacea]